MEVYIQFLKFVGITNFSDWLKYIFWRFHGVGDKFNNSVKIAKFLKEF